MSLITNYLHPLFSPKVFNTRITNLVRLIKRSNIRFKAIAFRGMSGAMVAPMVAARLNKQMLMVRKDSHGEDTNSIYIIEGRTDIRSYIIIDDMIDTGNTIRKIKEEVDTLTFKRAKLIGVFLYNHSFKESEEELQDILNIKVPIIKLHVPSRFQNF